MSLLDKIAANLAPHDCLGCGREGRLLCYACLNKLPRVGRLPVGEHLTYLQAFTIYEGVAKKLIWKLKSGGAQAAAEDMAKALIGLLPREKKVIIVSIPTATSRVRQRGYNQAQLLGRRLGRQARLPWLDCLARSGQLHQVGANREQRRRQLQNSLWVTQRRWVRGAHIILVDDVVTTGATFEVAASLLKAAGARRVDALAFAWTRPNKKYPV